MARMDGPCPGGCHDRNGRSSLPRHHPRGAGHLRWRDRRCGVRILRRGASEQPAGERIFDHDRLRPALIRADLGDITAPRHIGRTGPGTFVVLEHLAVVAEAARSGVGTALLDAVRAVGGAAGCSHLVTDVWDGNKEAQAFYAAAGFAPMVHRLEQPLR